MLAMSRFAGESIIIGTRSNCLLTVLGMQPEAGTALVQVCRAIAERPGQLEYRTISIRQDQSIAIDRELSVELLEVSGDKVRLGIEAPWDCFVHRLEVYEAMLRKTR